MKDQPEIHEEENLDEKQDACYHKVKSRYKIWPSAYASGALSKCRKVGAKNWGNKSEATTMKEEQLRNIVREVIQEVWEEQAQMEEMCWECYESAMEEGTNEAWEECYRKTNWDMVPEGEEHTCEGDEFYEIYGDINADAKENLEEAEYRGRKVPLGKPMRGDVKKFKVFVRNPSTGNVKKVNFGDKKMRIKKSNPKRRKSFRARHRCSNPGPRTSARYWSCRKW
jgi:predicted transcriptional regulator